MSYYTNDIDTLRQLVSQALPQIVRSGAILATILGIMGLEQPSEMTGKNLLAE